ncbi:Hsp20/alpha crystallin family protein [Candidatus Parcubacteria bacterium]|nr:Hsp20/alpha crystallin family protein [Candidatus Parcubacteria bacterium]
MKKFLKKLYGLDKRSGIEEEEIEEEVQDQDDEDLYYENESSKDKEELEEDEEMEEEIEEEEEEKGSMPAEIEDEWPAEEFEEGQLSIDVFQTPKAIMIKSTIAGVKPEDIDISINNDMLTIRGHRELNEVVEEQDYLFRECYWGSFSRSIILPVEIEADKVEATIENGVLSITLPKAKNAQQIQIKVKEK